MRALATAPNPNSLWERNKAQAVKNSKRRRLEVMTLTADDAENIGTISMQAIATEQRCIVVASGGIHRGRIFWPGEQQG